MPLPEIASVVVQELAEELIQTFLAAAGRLTDELASIAGDPEQFRRQARVREMLGQIDDAVDSMEDEARRWANRRLPNAHRFGAQMMAQDLGVEWQGFVQADVDAIATLVSDTMADVLEHTTYMRDSAKRLIREAGRDAAAGGLVVGQTARQTGADLARRLTGEGVTSVIYRNGTAMPVGAYAEMLARTKTAEAMTVGGLVQAEAWGCRWLECFDGPACGWGSHYDLEPAHGKIVTVSEAADVPLAHPNCARSFGPRPDLKGADGQRARPGSKERQIAGDAIGDERTLAKARRGAQRAADGYSPLDAETPRSNRLADATGLAEAQGDALLRLTATDGTLTDRETYAVVRGHEEADSARLLYGDNPADPDGIEGFMLEVSDDLPDPERLAELLDDPDPPMIIRLQPGTRVVNVDGRRFTSGRYRIDTPGVQHYDADGFPTWYEVTARHEGTYWPSTPSEDGLTRLPARLDPPDLEDVLDRDLASRLNPWSPDDLARFRAAEQQREIAAAARGRRRARRSGPTSARRVRPEPDFGDVDALGTTIPTWARGTPYEDAVRQFDADGGFLPFLKPESVPGAHHSYYVGRRPNRRIESRHAEDHWPKIDDEVTLRTWLNPDGTPTVRALRHEELLNEAGGVVDDEIHRRTRERLRAQGVDLPAAESAYKAAVDARDVFYSGRGPGLIRDALGVSNADAAKLAEAFAASPFPRLGIGPGRLGTGAEGERLLGLFRDFDALDDTNAAVKAFHLERGLLGDDTRAAAQAMTAAKQASGMAYRDATREVLGEIRPMGGELRFDKAARSGKPLEGQRALNEAASYYPTDWIERSNARGEVNVGWIARGHHSYNADTGRSDIRLSRAERGFPDQGQHVGVSIHELGHRMEQVIPGLRPSEWLFHRRRTTVDGVRTAERHLGRGYGARERFYEDRWDQNYMGKTYGGGSYNDSWELFTMGSEAIHAGTQGGLVTDQDYRRWMLGNLALL